MQSQTFHIGGNGGISIAAEATGNADALPVLLAHGGGQTRHAWKRVTADLANAGFRPIAIDCAVMATANGLPRALTKRATSLQISLRSLQKWTASQRSSGPPLAGWPD